MKIEVKRITKLPKVTLGELYVNGSFECYTLEDTVREVKGAPVETWKIPHVTAIPAGTYNVVISMSTRFKKLLPEIQNVPGYSGVRIHAGNTTEDTDGCIIVGKIKKVVSLGSSVIALTSLQSKIQSALDRGETVTLTIG